MAGALNDASASSPDSKENLRTSLVSTFNCGLNLARNPDAFVLNDGAFCNRAVAATGSPGPDGIRSEGWPAYGQRLACRAVR